MFKCPYCETTHFKDKKPFTTWVNVRRHTSVCERRTGEWFIDANLGPIHYTSLQRIDREEALIRFSGLSASLKNIRHSFTSRGFKIDCYPRGKTEEEWLVPIRRFYKLHGRIPKINDIIEGPYINDKFGWKEAITLAGYETTHYPKNRKNTYTNQYLLNQILKFYKINNRSPTAKDFRNNSNYPNYYTYLRRFGSFKKALALVGLESKKRGYTKEELIAIGLKYLNENGCYPISTDFGGDLPSVITIQKYFKSWNAYIVALGGVPQEAGVYGIPTQGLDGKMYRSRLEAKFADKLFGVVNYEYETPYPPPYHRYYDFYLPDYDVYVEIDGMGSSRNRDSIAEKREINDRLGRKLIVLYSSDIDTFNLKKI